MLGGMTRMPSVILLFGLTAILALPTQTALAYDLLGDDYSIMVPEKGSRPKTPEPWLAPKYKSPRGTVKHVALPKSKIVSPPQTVVPADVYVPQTGRTFQNLPAVSGSGPRGTETFQDRAMRCAHQAGVYGQGTTGNY